MKKILVKRFTRFLAVILFLGIYGNMGYSQEKEKPDYTSKVPQYNFGNTLEEQEAQLKDNPMMERFAKSREFLSADPYRPTYHYVNSEGKLNDPNGFCYWQGRWHLFYQAYPPEDPRQHWGHAVSDDLIHWRDLPLAIYPGPEQACFSGNVMIENDRAIAMYPGIGLGLMVAISDDPLLLNWKKLTGDAVFPYNEWEWLGGALKGYNHQDPFIWKEGDFYYCIVGDVSPTGPAGKPVRVNYLSKSKDLENWEYLHPFVEDDDYSLVGDDGSCPYFLPIGDKYILIYFSHQSGAKYLIGDYDTERQKFKVISGGNFNKGPVHPAGICAPSAFPDGKGRVITILNLGSGKPPVKGDWNQIVALPLRLTLEGDETLKIEPAGDIESLHYDHKNISNMALPANKDVVLDGISGKAMELFVEIEPNGAPMIEIDVCRSPGKEEYTRITFLKDRGYQYDSRTQLRFSSSFNPKKLESQVSIDATRASLAPDVRSRGSETAFFVMEDETLKLRIFIDRSSIEVFVDGKEYLATRIYPSLNESTGVSIRAQGQNAVLKTLDAWQMKNIWEREEND